MAFVPANDLLKIETGQKDPSESVSVVLATGSYLNINKDTLATSSAQELQRVLLSGVATESKLELVRLLTSSVDTKISTLSTDAKLEAVRLLLAGTLNIDKSNLSTSALQTAGNTAIAAINTALGLQAKLTDSQPVNLQVGGNAIAAGAGATDAQTLRVAQVTDDVLRLRSLAPRKPAAVTLTTTEPIDLISAPSNPAHRHVICWMCGQNATDIGTVAEFTGGDVPIKIIASAKSGGRDFTADPQIMTLTAGAAFRVGQSVATTFEASCGYYTIDATGAPV